MKRLLVGVIGCFTVCALMACGNVDESDILSDNSLNDVASVEGSDSPYAVRCSDYPYHSASFTNWDCANKTVAQNGSYCQNEWRNVTGKWCNGDTSWRQACYNMHAGCRAHGSWRYNWGDGRYVCTYATQTISCRCYCMLG